ncbi:aminotransferase class V-fold PLP-dependent enzyme [Saxibacter everestensis]|uniref:Aminotransferase class V-fold PLP-dependent enzyme n=1 Tax=Saxibacter everestensis TaxID=2909229 RepID=A0ABY8QNI1_9MICO|nr:aminotransferase class V-fold PLP-dependent enzyme [Brevibacteriaceae bacterium ZFBP1038]
MTILDSRSAVTASGASADSDPAGIVLGGDLTIPLLGGDVVSYANLDYAASAPALTEVANFLNDISPYYASVHRGAGYLSQVSTSVYESARLAVSAFVNARDGDSVIFTANTTDSLNLLAGVVASGVADTGGGLRRDVVYLDIEHHANLLPWQAIDHRVVSVRNTLRETIDELDVELAGAPAALLAVTGASNVTGEVLPLRELAELAHRHGARIAVDAAQLAPHRRIDVAGDNIDYLVFSGHKLYAPFGSGVVVGRADWLDAGKPHRAGGGAVREVQANSVSWTTGPARHEAGSPNVLGAAAIAKACKVLQNLDQDDWHEHEEHLRRRLVDGVADIDGVETHRIWAEESLDAVGIVTFSVRGYDPGLVAAYLSAEHGVGVRDGRFCAHPLTKALGLDRGGCRASFGLGSTEDDVDRLLEGLRALLDGGPQASYVVDAGRWVPEHETRHFPAWAPPISGTAGASPCEAD